MAQNMIGILQGARATILAQGILDRAYFDGALETLDAWAHRPDAALWYAICWAEGIRQS